MASLTSVGYRDMSSLPVKTLFGVLLPLVFKCISVLLWISLKPISLISIPFGVLNVTFCFRSRSGLFINNILGKISVNTRFTHGFILCVDGFRKCIPSVYTARKIDIVTTIMVKRRYFPIRGITNDVGGLMSDSKRKNTVSASKIEIDKVIFSPLSDGR